MAGQYPEVEPSASGMLDVGDGHEVYWETLGKPAGAPAVYLHGGPGTGCGARHRRNFAPSAYRAVLFDQRGCGRSRPLADTAAADLSANTTEHLLRDIERLREHLGIDRWVVVGGLLGCDPRPGLRPAPPGPGDRDGAGRGHLGDAARDGLDHP